MVPSAPAVYPYDQMKTRLPRSPGIQMVAGRADGALRRRRDGKSRYGWLLTGLAVLGLAWVKSCTVANTGEDGARLSQAGRNRARAVGLAVWRAKIAAAE